MTNFPMKGGSRMGKYNERVKILLNTVGAIASIVSAVIAVIQIGISIIKYVKQKSNRPSQG